MTRSWSPRPSQGTGDFGLARFNADGTLDTSFGTGGQVVTDFGAVDVATGAALTPDGKIVVVGDTGLGGTANPTDYALARYTSNGTLDTSFGMGGKVVTNFLFAATARGVAVQPDGKIVVVGSQGMVRYNLDGSLDTAFGTGGVVTDFSDRVVLQPDGGIIGAASNGVGRHTANGSADLNFGYSVDGTSTVFSFAGEHIDNFFFGDAVALQPDGKILLAGNYPTISPREIGLVRFNVNGDLDATFGAGGLAVFPATGGMNAWTPYALSVESDGRILVAGAEIIGAGTPAPFPRIIRFDPNGSVDSSFSAPTSGIVGVVTGLGLALQSDGKILVSGVSTSGSAAVNRLLTDDPLPTASQRFVAQAYLDLLQRTAEPGGLSYWSGLIDQGQATRAQVVSGIEASPEYRGIEVQGFFGLLLNRAATPDELNAYVSFLARGGTVEQAEVTIVGSVEYAFGTPNDTFVNILYGKVFDRVVDTAARNALDQALASGTLTRQQVGAVIFSSMEYFGDLVQGLYHRFLHRPADPTGLSNAVNALTSGALGDEGVIAGIVGSDEYLAERT